jgi:hypothetical protein
MPLRRSKKTRTRNEWDTSPPDYDNSNLLGKNLNHKEKYNSQCPSLITLCFSQLVSVYIEAVHFRKKNQEHLLFLLLYAWV